MTDEEQLREILASLDVDDTAGLAGTDFVTLRTLAGICRRLRCREVAAETCKSVADLRLFELVLALEWVVTTAAVAGPSNPDIVRQYRAALAEWLGNGNASV